MNHEALQILLVEYVDGSIPPEQKEFVEAALRSSRQLCDELEEIRFAFTTLQSQSIPEVPQHYFTNFVPRLRERIDQDQKKHSFIVPDWLQQIFRPAAALTVIMTFFVFYQIFQPRIQQHHVHEIVLNAQNEDLSEFTHYAAMETDDTEQLVERLSELISHNSLEQQFQNTVAKNSGHFESEANELVYATFESIVSELNDEEMNLVIEKIDSPTKN